MTLRDLFGMAPRGEFKPGDVAVFVWGAWSDEVQKDNAGRRLGRAADGDDVLVLSGLERDETMIGNCGYRVRFRSGQVCRVSAHTLRKRRPDDDDSAEPRSVSDWSRCVWKPEGVREHA